MTAVAYHAVPPELLVPDSLADLEEFMRFTLGACTPADVTAAVAPVSFDRLPVSATDVVRGVALFEFERAATIDHCRLWRGAMEIPLSGGGRLPRTHRPDPGDTLTVTFDLRGQDRLR